MKVKVEINSISHESWTGKDGKQQKGLRLYCNDKSTDGARFQGPMILSPDRSQEELFPRLREDSMIEVEIVGIRTLGTTTLFSAFLVPSSLSSESSTPAKPKAA